MGRISRKKVLRDSTSTPKSIVAHDAEIEKRIVKKLDWNLVPLVMVMCKFDLGKLASSGPVTDRGRIIDLLAFPRPQ